MTMIKPINLYQIILSLCCFIWVTLISAGCAHNGAQGKASAEQKVQASATLEKRRDLVVGQKVQASATLEKKGDLVNAVEWLKVALVVDPNNATVRDELNRLIVKRNQEAERHFKAGVDLRNSNPQGAKKKFLDALRIRGDYPEAVAALRELQLESAEAVIRGREIQEAKLAATGTHGKTETAEDEEEVDREEYSLDIAISAFETGDYETAIHEFEKMKARYPRDPDILLYLNRSWYNSGIAWFTKQDYKRALSLFIKVPKGFERVNEYIAKCRSALKIPASGTGKPAQKKSK
jgi:tetratricopeptide (TPR) repeat protein